MTMSDSGFLQVSFLGTEQTTSSSLAQQLRDTTKVDYEYMNSEHSKILKQIKHLEDERQEEPTDAIKLTCELQPLLEETKDYVEDPQKLIAVDQRKGRLLRARLKITLAYAAGSNPVSPYFRQVQVNIDLNRHSYMCEESVFEFPDLSFEHSQTPNVIQTYVYPLQRMISGEPIQVSVTYQQIKDQSQIQGTLRSCSVEVPIPFSH